MSSLNFKVDCVNEHWGFWANGFRLKDFRAAPKFKRTQGRIKQADGSPHIIIIDQPIPVIDIINSLRHQRCFFHLGYTPDIFDENTVIQWVGHTVHLPIPCIVPQLLLKGVTPYEIMAMYYHPAESEAIHLSNIDLRKSRVRPILSCCHTND